MSLRVADKSDIPTIQALIDEFTAPHLEDDQEAPTALEVLESGYTVMIDRYGFPVGAFYLHDITDRLHATISLLLRPKHMRQAFRDNIFGEFLDKAFAAMGFRKLKARALRTQTGAVKLLKRYRFFRTCELWNETWIGGKATDVFWFELQRKYWTSHRQEILTNGKHRTQHNDPASRAG